MEIYHSNLLWQIEALADCIHHHVPTDDSVSLGSSQSVVDMAEGISVGSFCSIRESSNKQPWFKDFPMALPKPSLGQCHSLPPIILNTLNILPCHTLLSHRSGWNVVWSFSLLIYLSQEFPPITFWSVQSCLGSASWRTQAGTDNDPFLKC